jgi:hypothetical protein
MTSLELLQEIDAWLNFNNSPSKEQISKLRNDIKKHISEQLNILHVRLSLPDEDVSEPIQNALYATNAFTTDQCSNITDGILLYLKDAGFEIVKGQ